MIELGQLFPDSSRPTLRKLELLHPDRPLAGCKVLHAIPLFKNTLAMIEAAAYLGADLVVTSFPGAPYDAACIEWLKERGIEFAEPGKARGAFDYILDCGGAYQHLATQQTQAIVELTRSGAIEYARWVRPDRPPVISVDDSGVKLLEDIFGLADGFVRGLSKQLGQLPKTGVLVIGAGKVGQGCASGALEFAHPVGLVDLDLSKLRVPDTLRAKVSLHTSTEVIEHPDRFAEFGVVVTATAVPEVMSRHFTPGMFRGRTLANMGIGDEWGDAYASEEVLCSKGILNFALEEPTRLVFLDPSFSAMLQTLVTLESGDWQARSGFHTLPTPIESATLLSWMKAYSFAHPWQRSLARELGLLV